MQLGEPVDLATIDVPTFVYASKEDHIVPWKTAYESTQLVGGDVTFVLGASGHIAGVINPPAKNKRNYWIRRDARRRPGALVRGRGEGPGQLVARLVRVAGAARRHQVNARKTPGNAEFTAIEPAPGSYVKAKAE